MIYRTVRQYDPERNLVRIYEVRDYQARILQPRCAVKDENGRWLTYVEGSYFPTTTRVDSPTLEDMRLGFSQVVHG